MGFLEVVIGWVYGLVDPSNNQVRYVGITTKHPLDRFQEHLKESIRDRSRRVYKWIRSMPWSPDFIVLEETEDEFLKESEKEWIAWYRSKNLSICELTNGTDGGDGTWGYRFSEESKIKMSQSQKGNKNSLGYVPSEEKRRKISIANTGYVPSEETRRKISESSKGRKHTQETKDKIRNALIGHKFSEETRIKISNTKRGVARGYS